MSRELDEAGGTRAKNLARVAMPRLSFFFSFCCTSTYSSVRTRQIKLLRISLLNFKSSLQESSQARILCTFHVMRKNFRG